MAAHSTQQTLMLQMMPPETPQTPPETPPEIPQTIKKEALIWIGFLLLVLLPPLIVLADGWWRARHAGHYAGLWFEALDLSAPALWPAGTPQRHPQTLWPGMDLRFFPLCCKSDISDISGISGVRDIKHLR